MTKLTKNAQISGVQAQSKMARTVSEKMSTRPYSESNGVLLYLGINGVLKHAASPYNAGMWEWVSHLQTILANYPNTRLIIASHLSQLYPKSKLLTRLPMDIRTKVEGFVVEASSTMPCHARILADVAYRGVGEHWIVLSAHHDDWPVKLLTHLVPSDPDKGLSCATTRAWLRASLMLHSIR